jgi:putative molybdopterin biosynthesis protein
MEHMKPFDRNENIPTHACLDRITACAVFANVSNPPFLCSAMDGFAVQHENTLDADLSRPLILAKSDEVFAVNTGDILPEATDAVIMIEDAEVSGTSITIRKPVYLWQNTRMVGEDVIERDMLLPVNYRITAFDIGMMISAGIATVAVRSKPRVLIVPTGHELVDIFSNKTGNEQGELIDFNSHTLKSLAGETGCDPVVSDIVATREELMQVIKQGSSGYDLIMINAGSSAGTEDYTGSVIGELGEVIFHGVSMMPGKPLLFGIVGNVPVFGIPGYPVSAVLTFMRFVRPVFEKFLCTTFVQNIVPCLTAYKMPSRIGIEEIIRVNLVRNHGRYYAVPLARGASAFSSMAKADGLIVIPEQVEGFEEGIEVPCELLRDEAQIKSRIHIIGSHDLLLDVARDIVKCRHPGMDLISTHTGSLSGILAIRSGVAGLATTHILDEDGETYNIPAVKKYLSEIPLQLIHIAKRQQGILIRKGNPLSIQSIADLARPAVRFVNRQFGSGTRILFDHLLNLAHMDKRAITGYDREESSHTAVGILVRESIADAGIGIYSVARAFFPGFYSPCRGRL